MKLGKTSKIKAFAFSNHTFSNEEIYGKWESWLNSINVFIDKNKVTNISFTQSPGVPGCTVWTVWITYND